MSEVMKIKMEQERMVREVAIKAAKELESLGLDTEYSVVFLKKDVKLIDVLNHCG